MEFEVKILDEAGLLEFQGGAPKKNSDRFTYEDFTFETFVVGPSNKLAYAASMAVAEHPAQNYNPLLIYGDSGLGKTHLLYAIANVIRQNDPAAKIVYIKGDDFINEFIELIRAGRGSDFRASTGRQTFCWWTTCSSWPARNRSRMNSSIPSITCTNPVSRSF